MKNDIYPLVVVLDRYNGTYSGGKWTAWNLSYVPSKIDADDTECADFFAKNMIVYGRGETPQEAIDDLKMILNCGISDPDEEDEDEEEEKMEPTSVWRIENIDDIWIAQDVDGMSLMLKNKDDLTKIVMTGDAIDNFNDKFVISLQADMIEYAKKMRKLEKENEELKAKSKEISNDNALFLATNKKLKEENEELKQLKTPTIENFADEEPSSRRDILKAAEKCVCGQREQDYGTPESNFQLIADLWNNYLGITDYVLDMEQRFMDLNEKGIKVDVDFPKPKTIFPEDVSMMMALLKIARIRNGGGSGDSFVDLAGYAACGGEIWASKRYQKYQN